MLLVLYEQGRKQKNVGVH